MKTTLKAVVWSALVFPGAGYFVLRRPARGWICVGATIASLGYVIHDIFARGLIDQAVDLANRFMTGEISTDPMTVLSLLDTGQDPIGVEFASMLLLACWAFGIYDCWRIGDKQDRALNLN